MHKFQERFITVKVTSDTAELLVLNFDSLCKNLPIMDQEDIDEEGKGKYKETFNILMNYAMNKVNFVSK